jgi:tetratricopeptide (TPR) repeat protein
MKLISLIRNKWFILIFSFFFCGVSWAAFQSVYEKELLLIDMYNSDSPDTLKVTELYNEWMESVPKRDEIGLYYRLSKILSKIDKKKEAIEILEKLVNTFSEDRNMRLWLAVELHNQERYTEAEEHFNILLKEKAEE